VQSEPAELVVVAPQIAPSVPLAAHLPDAQYSVAEHPELSAHETTQCFASAQAPDTHGVGGASEQAPWPLQLDVAV
jgi:hypothetical protein